MKALEWLALIIVVIAAIDWGIFGLFNFDFLSYLFASMEWLMKTIYVVVGLAGIVLLICKFTPSSK